MNEMENIKKWRDFNKFMGETIRDYLNRILYFKEGHENDGWSPHVGKVKKEFNNIAFRNFGVYMNGYDQPNEGEKMADFIYNHLGKKYAHRYNHLKDFKYTNVKGHKINQEQLRYIADNIVDLITRTQTTFQPITKTEKFGSYITDLYNGLHEIPDSAKFKNINDIYNDVIGNQKRQYDNDIKHLIQEHNKDIDELSANKDNEHKKAIEEIITKKDKEKKAALDEAAKESTERARDAATKMKHKMEKRNEKAKDYVDDTAEEVETTKELKYDSDDEEEPRDKAKSAAQQIDAKLKEDAIITRAALDNDFYSQLPEDIKQTLKNKIDEKKTIIERSKVIRYLLPKERPKWETATMNKGMNPMLARGAWRM